MADYDERTALVVVDVQNDFAHPDGSLYVDGAAAAIARTNEEICRALEGGALVAYSQDWHPEHTPHFAQDGGVWPVHGVADSWGAELHADLAVAEGAPRVRKGADGSDGYSAFSQRDPQSGEEEATELEALLRDRGVERLVITGLATDYCVKETALDACRLGFTTTVIAEAISAVNLEPGDGERALAAIREAGATIE
ncbi:MAG: isochorismatase family protein [Chloroflexi bacterium]|nr:isochorismatase family protein [Chloroflexota bacterium]